MNKKIFLTGLIWLVLFALPLFMDEWDLAGFGQLLIYGIAALSLSFIWGELGLVSFGQALFFGSGAYVMALGAKGMIFEGLINPWVWLILAALSGAILAALLGAMLFFGKGLRLAYFGIVTIAAAVIAERLTTNWRYIGGFNGLMDVPPLPFFAQDSAEPLVGYFITLILAVLVWLGLLALQRSPFGTVLRGIRCDERRMQSLGYAVAFWKLTALSISGFVAGIAGALFAAQFSFVSPTVIGLTLSTEILIWAAVGGKGVLMAAFLGAVFVKWVENELSEAIGAWWLLVTGLGFVTIIVLLPRGLLGWILDLGLPKRLRQK